MRVRLPAWLCRAGPMNRRGFLKAALAGPWVITTAGVLMPVRNLATRSAEDELIAAYGPVVGEYFVQLTRRMQDCSRAMFELGAAARLAEQRMTKLMLWRARRHSRLTYPL